MLSRVSLALFATTTFLTPLQVSLAQEANAGGCSIMTIVSDAGEITWNTDGAAAELISIAKETNLTPEEAHELCHGEAVTQKAESDEAVEEDTVANVASADEVGVADENDRSDGIGVSALLPLAALGLVAAVAAVAAPQFLTAPTGIQSLETMGLNIVTNQCSRPSIRCR